MAKYSNSDDFKVNKHLIELIILIDIITNIFWINQFV